jgi:hypothetical protein
MRDCRNEGLCKCLPTQETLVGALSFVLLVYSATMFFFGRGIIPIVAGVAGMVASMEGYHGSRTRALTVLRGYMWFLVFNFLSSLLFGYFIWQGYSEQDQCATAEFKDKCENTFRLYGYIYGIFGSTLSLVMLMVIWLRFRQIRREKSWSRDDEHGDRCCGCCCGCYCE